MTIKPVINLIQRQAALTPDNTAIVYDGRSYTYRDVMAQACGITQQIREAGLAKDDVVGILIPRNQWLAMALLAYWLPDVPICLWIPPILQSV